MAYKYKVMIFSGAQLKYWWSILIVEEKLFLAGVEDFENC